MGSMKPQICIPATGDILLINIHRDRFFISIGGFLIISSVSGIWRRKSIRPRKMIAMKRFYDFVTCDNLAKCNKCIHYPIKFHKSIVEGNEIDYSGFEITLLDKIFRRKEL